jgi:hypothetical protein
MKSNPTLTLSKEEMKSYGYKIIDTIIEHFEIQNTKNQYINQLEQKWMLYFWKKLQSKGKR